MKKGSPSIRTFRASTHSQSGVGLIEILIAVLLISIGFLAAARMQVEGMRFSQSAYFQSQANFLAGDLIDRMRSNARGVADGHYTDMSTSPTAENPQCSLNPCMPDDIARQDLYDLSSALHPMGATSGFVAVLPGTASKASKATIEEIGDGVYAVVMNWNEIIGGANTEQSLRIQFAVEDSQ